MPIPLTVKLKGHLKRIIPKNAARLATSFHHCLRLRVLVPYLKSLLNSAGKLRLGTDYGGWTIPKDVLGEQSICYCVGCGEDISFDLALAQKYSCEVFGFDPTPRSIAYVRKTTAGIQNYHFEDIGVWDREGVAKFFAPRDGRHVSHSITNLQNTRDYIEVRTLRLKQVLERNGHEKLSLLKLDIEGAENAVIRTIVEDNLTIDTLCIEFDELGFPTLERIKNIRASIDGLFACGYRIFWVEGSNFTFVR
jgi:FkbM family methyltransferase